jgi:hypothetical protein
MYFLSYIDDTSLNIGVNMKSKSLKLLRISTLVMGWLVVAGVLAGIWGRVALYYQGQSDPTSFLGSLAARFELLSALSSFFADLGNALFAFLIAAVVRMIEKRAPVEHEYARRLMITCCLAYVAEAAVRFFSFSLILSRVLHAMNGVGTLGPHSSSATLVLAPVIYAVSIFVLYSHFTQMVTFESEVA